MATDEFVFAWAIPSDGFRWISASDKKKKAKPKLFLNKNDESRLAAHRESHPLEQTPALFREFGDLPPTEEGILEFANTYGDLGLNRVLTYLMSDIKGYDNSGDTFDHWVAEIRDMRDSLMLWDALRESNWDFLVASFPDELPETSTDHAVYLSGAKVKSDGTYAVRTDTPEGVIETTRHVADLGSRALEVIQENINNRLRYLTSPRLLHVIYRGRPELYTVPINLLGALWLQFAKTVDEEKEHKRCEVCAGWFEVSPHERGVSRHYCSNACRSKAYRDRQDKARRLWAAGMPLEDIVNTLGTDVDATRGWVSGLKNH